MGEGIIEASITRWLVTSGQHVLADQPLVEVATDKVDSEIPSPVEGTVIRLVYREGEMPKVGDVIALIETNSIDINGTKISEPERTIIEPPAPGRPVLPVKARQNKVINQEQGDNVYLSPLVRMLARQRGISPGELLRIRATGLHGRITRNDLNQYIISGRQADEEAGIFPGKNDDNQQGQSAEEPRPDEVIEMTRLRKIIAGKMVKSKRTAPHVTSFLEADITALVAWRLTRKEAFYQAEHARLTFTPVIIAAVARALQEFPRINVSVSGETIILRKNINIGFATALPDGNLIVPVIRNADKESLGGLARQVADLAERARKNTLLPAEIKGGTFTITNIGQYNNLTGTPIINQPEAAILAVGTIMKKPWAVKTGEGYGLAVRDVSMLSLTYDHRIIDGALGGSFLSRIAQYLEDFDTGMNTSNR